MLSRLKKKSGLESIYFLNWWVSKISHTTILKLEGLLLSLHEELSPYSTSLLLFLHKSTVAYS